MWAVFECYSDVVYCTVISVDDEMFLCVGFRRINYWTIVVGWFPCNSITDVASVKTISDGTAGNPIKMQFKN